MHILQNASLKKKLVFIIILSVVIPLILVSIFALYLFKQESSHNGILNYTNTSAIISQRALETLNDLDEQTKTIYHNETIVNSMHESRNRTLSPYETYSFQRALASFMNVDKHIIGAYIICNGHEYYSTRIQSKQIKNIIASYAHYFPALNPSGLFSFLPLYNETYSNGQVVRALPVARVARDIRHNYEQIGNILILYDVSSFDPICYNLTLEDDIQVLLIDSNNTVVWSNMADNIGNSASEFFIPPNNAAIQSNGYQVVGPNDKYYLYRTAIPEYGFTCATLVPAYHIMNGIGSFYLYFVFVAIVLLVFFFLILFFMQRSIIVPIQRLIVYMSSDSAENKFSMLNQQDEIGFLYRSFENMRQKNQELLKSIENNHLQQIRHQSDALKAQLNPHFLYNTLDAINWMALSSKAYQISDLITLFSNVLRYSVKTTSDLVPLSSEVQYVKNYFAIQRYLHENHFSLIFDYEPHVLQYKTIHFTLQPFVENAMKHGFVDRDSGYIKISIHEDGTDLLITVEDNGVGIPAQIVDQIHLGYGGGIGIHHINELLKIHFGPAYGVHLDTKENQGTTVTIRIPKIKEEADECTL